MQHLLPAFTCVAPCSSSKLRVSTQPLSTFKGARRAAVARRSTRVTRSESWTGEETVQRRNILAKLLPGVLALCPPAFADIDGNAPTRAPRWVGGLLLTFSGVAFSWVAAKSLDATRFMETDDEPAQDVAQAASEAAPEADPASLLTAASKKSIDQVMDGVSWPEKFPWPDEYFKRADETEDIFFYVMPRFLTHIDDPAILALTKYYSQVFPPSGGDDVALLDICSSWISHYPQGYTAGRISGLGMNKAELDRNPVLTDWVVKDLNQAPELPYQDSTFDVVTNAVSVDYLCRPLEVMKEVNRVLKPGGLAIMSFSNRCFPTKVIQIWNQTSDPQHVFIVGSYFKYTPGFDSITTEDISPNPGRSDPMYVICARKVVS